MGTILIELSLIYWYNITGSKRAKNMNISQQYIGSIVILLISLLKMFKIDIGSEELTAIITGAIALWVAIKRFQKGDINVAGIK